MPNFVIHEEDYNLKHEILNFNKWNQSGKYIKEYKASVISSFRIGR